MPAVGWKQCPVWLSWVVRVPTSHIGRRLVSGHRTGQYFLTSGKSPVRSLYIETRLLGLPRLLVSHRRAAHPDVNDRVAAVNATLLNHASQRRLKIDRVARGSLKILSRWPGKAISTVMWYSELTSPALRAGGLRGGSPSKKSRSQSFVPRSADLPNLRWPLTSLYGPGGGDWCFCFGRSPLGSSSEANARADHRFPPAGL